MHIPLLSPHNTPILFSDLLSLTYRPQHERTVSRNAFRASCPIFNRQQSTPVPEERTGFELPPGYSASGSFAAPRGDGQSSRGASPPPLGTGEEIEAEDRLDLRGAFRNSHLTGEKHTIVPSVSKDGAVFVDWYSSDDPANPQNRSSKKKAFVAMQIWYAFKFSPAKSQPLY